MYRFTRPVMAATLAVTGCLHEDGFADTADGLGGGATRERKLEIMRDSRIGTYGVCALTVSLLLRASALAYLADPALVAAALIAVHGAARATMPARSAAPRCGPSTRATSWSSAANFAPLRSSSTGRR